MAKAGVVALAKVIGGADIDVIELARYLGNSRTDTLESSILCKLVKQYEDHLVEEFSKQQDLPLDPLDPEAEKETL